MMHCGDGRQSGPNRHRDPECAGTAEQKAPTAACRVQTGESVDAISDGAADILAPTALDIRESRASGGSGESRLLKQTHEHARRGWFQSRYLACCRSNKLLLKIFTNA